MHKLRCHKTKKSLSAKRVDEVHHTAMGFRSPKTKRSKRLKTDDAMSTVSHSVSVESAIVSAVNVIDDNNDEQNMSSCVLSDVEPDVTFSESMEITSCKTNEITGSQKGWYTCDMCGSIHDESKDLSSHRTKCHSKTVHMCDFPACNYVAHKVTALRMHKRTRHCQSSADSKLRHDTSSHSVNLDVNDTELLLSLEAHNLSLIHI